MDSRESIPLPQGSLEPMENEFQMHNLSRESTFLSQGAMDTLVNMNAVQFSNLDSLLNTEELLVGDGLLQDASFLKGLEYQIPEMQQFEMLPDSTDVEVKMPLHPLSSVSTCKMPCTEDYPGPCGFNLELSNSVGKKTNWEYSVSLNKLFVRMHSKVPVKFKTNRNECGLYVRVVPIFLAEDSFTEPVRRCAAHASHLEESNKDFPHVDHIVRCHHQHAMYVKDKESSRLSVVVPLDNPQPGCDWSTTMYSFMCKNSCGVGMNRRSTALIFTLEKQNGEVIGRRLMNIRICSCPRRDRGKDEQKLNTEHCMVNSTTNQCVMDSGKKTLKRLKKERGGNFCIKLPEFYIKNVARTIKKVILTNQNLRKLTSEEEETLEDCDKYI